MSKKPEVKFAGVPDDAPTKKPPVVASRPIRPNGPDGVGLQGGLGGDKGRRGKSTNTPNYSLEKVEMVSFFKKPSQQQQ